MSSCWFTGICFREVLRLHWWISAVLPTNAGGSVRAWLQSVFSVFHASSGVHVEAKVCLPQPSALFTALFFSLEQCILVHFCGKCGEKSHFGDDQTARGKKKKRVCWLKKKGVVLSEDGVPASSCCYFPVRVYCRQQRNKKAWLLHHGVGFVMHQYSPPLYRNKKL